MGIYLKGQDFYPAQVSRDGGRYIARFVDIPNCLAFGASAFEAEVNAAHALASHLRFLGDIGGVLPNPSIVRDRPVERDGYIAHIMPPAERPAVMPLAKVA